jgi:Ca-activated chloride channel family protein
LIFFHFVVLLIIIFSYSETYADEVYTKNQKANTLYKQGKFDEALKLYDDALLLSPSDPKLKMNKGSSLYKLKQYDKAEEQYNSSLASDDKKLKADIHYNMGNILFRQGEQLQSSGNASAKEKYQEALKHYIQALDLKPSDKDTKWNLQLAHNRIKQVEQQQKQQQNKNDKKNKDDKKNDQDQKKDDQKNDQNKDQKQDQQQNKQDQDKKDQDQNKNQSEQDKQQQQQQNQSQMQQDKDKEMKKEEARRLLELYADDADSLNKPPKTKSSRQAQPSQDW